MPARAIGVAGAKPGIGRARCSPASTQAPTPVGGAQAFVAIAHRMDAARTLGKRMHDRRRREQDVEHDDDLALEAGRIELFAFEQHMEFGHGRTRGASGV